jgi:hypothetical protein
LLTTFTALRTPAALTALRTRAAFLALALNHWRLKRGPAGLLGQLGRAASANQISYRSVAARRLDLWRAHLAERLYGRRHGIQGS